MKPKIKIISFAFFLVTLLFAHTAVAALVNCGGSGQSPCQISDIIYLIVRIINYLLSWAWLVCIFFILLGGWEMINSGGNQESVSKGKETLKNAVIGFVLIMASFLLINLAVAMLTGSGDTTNSGAFQNIFDFIKPR